MNLDNIINEVVKIITHFLPSDYKIFLFGSWAKNNALDTSDIDIAILGKTKVEWDKMVQILNAKENIPTLRSIDIVDLNSKEENFKSNVLKYARPLI